MMNVGDDLEKKIAELSFLVFQSPLHDACFHSQNLWIDDVIIRYTQFIIILGLFQLNFYPVTGRVLLIRFIASPIVSCILSMSS